MVAENIRRFRRERELSLGDLARRTGISKQTLSKIEVGQGNPTVGTLEAIARGLGVNLAAMLATYGSIAKLQRAEDEPWREFGVGTMWSMDRIYGTGYVESGLYKLGAAATELISPHSRGTIHQVYLISGRVRVSGEFDSVSLAPGDFFRFPGDVQHQYTAERGEVLMHLITTAPQVAQFKPSMPEE